MEFSGTNSVARYPRFVSRTAEMDAAGFTVELWDASEITTNYAQECCSNAMWRIPRATSALRICAAQ
jgi:hypothetical protein